MSFNVNILQDSAGELKRRYVATASPAGLGLARGKDVAWSVAPGAAQATASGTELTVTQDDRTVRMNVDKFGHYAARLASDVAALIRGERPRVDERDYRLEWYLYALAALPLGIPIITLGGALPAGLGAGLAATNATVAQRESLGMGARVGIMAGITAAGYLALFLLIAAIRG